MQLEALNLAGLVKVIPHVRQDARGFFMESFNAKRFCEAGLTTEFVQDNHSCSTRHTIRGMHFQTQPGQDKLVRVVKGKIYDVAVDIRPDSKTFGKWQGVILDAEAHHQLLVPKGFAHGFCVMSDEAHVLYKCSALYDPKTEAGFAYNDASVGIRWPTTCPIVSERDQNAPSFLALKKRLTGS